MVVGIQLGNAQSSALGPQCLPAAAKHLQIGLAEAHLWPMCKYAYQSSSYSNHLASVTLHVSCGERLLLSCRAR